MVGVGGWGCLQGKGEQAGGDEEQGKEDGNQRLGGNNQAMLVGGYGEHDGAGVATVRRVRRNIDYQFICNDSWRWAGTPWL